VKYIWDIIAALAGGFFILSVVVLVVLSHALEAKLNQDKFEMKDWEDG
jgi:hypothetical protein